MLSLGKQTFDDASYSFEVSYEVNRGCVWIQAVVEVAEVVVGWRNLRLVVVVSDQF